MRDASLLVALREEAGAAASALTVRGGLLRRRPANVQAADGAYAPGAAGD
jgi:hypothetical protein